MKKRVNNPEKHLKGLIDDGTEFYIGFGLKSLTEAGNNHPDIIALMEGVKDAVVLSGKSGPLRENTAGKFIRKEPNVKVSIWRHIEYYHFTWARHMNFDREYYIWDKELLHKFNLDLRVAKTPQGETVFYFPKFTMKDDKKFYLKAGAAMNMSYAFSNYYALYDMDFNPIIPITKHKDTSLLPSGMSNRPVEEKLEVIAAGVKAGRNVESTGSSYRLAVLREQNPSDVTIGKDGFDDYLMFEFKKNDLLIFENLRTGNATYIFKLSLFDPARQLDKQNAVKDPSFQRRVIHENMESWSKQIGYFFK